MNNENMLNTVVAKWTGEYPKKCQGLWILEVDGKDVSVHIPDSKRNSSMYTYKEYTYEYPLGNFITEHVGLGWKKWIYQNRYWLKKITSSLDVKKQIFKAIQEQDFVKGCCGGCLLD